MEQDPSDNPQVKRKEAGSPDPAQSTKNKPTLTSTASGGQDAGEAISAATEAVRYAGELAESLAAEFYLEEHISPCLA